MLAYRNLARKLIRTAWPAVLEMMLYMVIGFVDVAVVGRLGPAPLAAVTLGAEIFFVIMMILAALGMGGTVLSAQATGARQPLKVNQVAGQILFLALATGTVVGVPLYIHTPWLVNLFPVEPEVYEMVVEYLRITTLITPLVLCLYMGNGIFRGTGRTTVPLVLASISNVVNIVGDYVLVFGKWGFPALGVKGAALATTMAHLTGFLMLLVVMFRGKYGVKPGLNDLLTPRPRVLREIVRLGFPTVVEDFLRGTSNFVSSYFLTKLGTVAFAAHQISITVESVSFMPGYGFAIAATALVGQSVGARKVKEAWASAYGSLLFAGLIMGAASLIFFFYPGYVACLFTNDRELVSITTLCLRIAALYQLFMALEMVLAGALRGAGDTRTPMLVAMMGIWLIRIPGMYLIVDVWRLQLTAVWWLFVFDWIFRSLIVTVVFLRGRWLSLRIRI